MSKRRKRSQSKTPSPEEQKKKYIVTGIAILVAVLLAVVIGVAANKSEVGTMREVTIETEQGQIGIEVYPDLMPVTVGNFEKLVQSKFYDGLAFHRVEDWVIQGGDPKGDGTGGPGWTIPLETNPQLKNVKGAVAMARAQDPDSAGSQFYILKQDASWLDVEYAVFGQVARGMEVVEKIKAGDKMTSVKFDQKK